VILFLFSLHYRFSLHRSFTFYVDVFCPLSLPRLLPHLSISMSNMADILLKEEDVSLLSVSLVGFVLLIFLVFLWVVLLCVFTFWVVLWCPLRFPHNNDMFGSPLTPIVCWRAHVLYTLFVLMCVEWCTTHIVLCFCLVFLRLCCQFLWIF
jgi:hypothetical protein